MRADIFQKALLATARVACCVSLLGACYKPEATKEPVEPVQPESKPAANASNAPTLDECKAHVNAVAALPENAPERQSAETTQCCVQIDASAMTVTEEKASAELWAAHDKCCNLSWKNAGCFAWGPPCPPAMGGVV